MTMSVETLAAAARVRQQVAEPRQVSQRAFKLPRVDLRQLRKLPIVLLGSVEPRAKQVEKHFESRGEALRARQANPRHARRRALHLQGESPRLRRRRARIDDADCEPALEDVLRQVGQGAERREGGRQMRQI